jgi:hypothetical protein
MPFRQGGDSFIDVDSREMGDELPVRGFEEDGDDEVRVFRKAPGLADGDWLRPGPLLIIFRWVLTTYPRSLICQILTGITRRHKVSFRITSDESAEPGE